METTIFPHYACRDLAAKAAASLSAAAAPQAPWPVGLRTVEPHFLQVL